MAFHASGLPVRSASLPSMRPNQVTIANNSLRALQSLAAAATDLLPSVANTLAVPWRGSTPAATPRHSRQQKPTERREPLRLPDAEATPTVWGYFLLRVDVWANKEVLTRIQTARPELPEFLKDVRLPQPSIPAGLSPENIQNSIADMARQNLAARRSSVERLLSQPRALSTSTAFARGITSPLQQFHMRRGASAGSLPRAGQVARFMSTMRQPIASRTLLGVAWCQPQQRGGPAALLLLSQRRAFSSGGISASLLASREAAANRNPSSATAQNAFYQVLLKANMPLIVMERYNSGRFAANEAATEAYQRALGMVSATQGGAAADLATNPIGGVAANNTQMTAAQLQAVSQAVAAQARGGNIAIAKGTQGTGAKDAPIHVVVDQPLSDHFFRWIKFILWFILITYLSLVVLNMLLEGMTVFGRRPGARQDNEVKAESQTTRFSDVHGCDEAKEELQELVEFLRNPDRFSTLGGKLPKGVLLVGPPGTGKTLLARAVAGEAGVPFFYMSGSEFDEVYVGVGAKRVRELFSAAKAKAPSIVFIDELDAIGGRRNARDAAYVKQTLNQLLTELDGFEQNSGVIIIAATNFPELLDKALTRPGRFDRHVQVDLPDVRGRLAILKHHAQKVKTASEVDLQAIALTTSGLSGAELESIVNQAAIHASKAKSLTVTVADFEWAKDKVIMGAERKSMVITPKEKEMTAYHEAGHALASFFSEGAPHKLYKVTILPRGMSLGHTAQLPEMDKYSMSAKEFLSMIDVSMGGKLAEEIVYGNEMTTSGVSSVRFFLLLRRFHLMPLTPLPPFLFLVLLIIMLTLTQRG